MRRSRLWTVTAVIVVTLLLAGACNESQEETPAGALSPEEAGVIEISKEMGQMMAKEFVQNSPTFSFDGIDDSLRLSDISSLSRSQYAWAFVFEFESRHAGYGDRTGHILAQMITPHTATIIVDRGEIVSAQLDEQWDMVRQEIIGEEEKPMRTMSITELLDNPVHDTEVGIDGTVGRLGELPCPCFELSSNGEKVTIWYDSMVENEGTEEPAVDIEGIKNGDEVVVCGKLKGEGGTHYSKGDFWATAIVVRMPVREAERATGISIDASSNGGKVHISVGHSLHIDLDSNPTTGFEWDLIDNSDEDVLREVRHEFKAPEQTEPPKVGASGIEVWHFEALKEGTSTISMAYSRPWESVPPTETFAVTVVVDENGAMQ